MLVMENKQRIILVIQIMTNNLVTLIQVNLRQKKLVMMTLTIPMRETCQTRVETARK